MEHWPRIVRRGLMIGLAGSLFVPTAVAFAAPTISLDRTIRTTPFTGTSTSMRDHEGSAYVPSNNSLWLADDNGDALFEVNPTTGALKRTIPQAAFNAATQFGGGPQAGANRTEDFESLAYDVNSDTLYVFSGPCCTSSMLPTAFRLTRQSGSLQVTDWQPLASTADYTGAAWNPADDKIYVGKAQLFRSFDYATVTQGQTFSVGGVSAITGMDFSSTGADLFITDGMERLRRINWASRTLVSGWTFDLTPFGVQNSRAVSLIGGRYFVSDAGSRASGDPLKYAVFVFAVSDSGSPPPSGNLIGNPGFEVNTSGWSVLGSGSGVTLSRVSPGRGGSAGAALLQNGSTGLRKCQLNDDPNWVTNTSAGTYTASIWVRADSGGDPIRLKLLEKSGTTVVRSRTASGTLITSWQQVTVVLSSVPSGRTLDVQVFVPLDFAGPGRCFYADDASITIS